MLYCRIHDIAKTDLEAANILAKNSLYPQAIYFYSQACEKAAKSVISMNLIHREKKTDEEVLWILKSHNYGHNLLKLAETTTKIFVDYEKGLYVKRVGKETDELIRTANELIKKIQDRRPDIQDLMAYYAGNVKVLYERLYSRLSENYSPIGAEHPYVGVLRELYKIPKSKYLKFNTLSQFLFILLDEMDIYSRYPMNDIAYVNISFLKGPEIREACSLLGEMVGELICLVPLVWSKIESLQT